jgi:hypothetical protein
MANVTMTPEQLIEIVGRVLAGAKKAATTEQTEALTAAMRNLTTGATPAGGSAKDIKFGKIKPFTGKIEDFDPFLRECFVRFEIQATIYDTATKKAAFMLSYFEKDSARLWKEAYYAERANKSFVENDDFDLFIDLLKESFTDTGRVQDALHDLQTLRQGNRPVDELNTVFRTYMQKAGLSKAHNRTILINYYQKALKPAMVQEIILKGTATSLDDWMKIATQLDAARRMINHMQSTSIAQKSKHHRQTFKPNFHYKPKTDRYQGEPMDVDFISPQERERRKEKGLCYECGQPGHMASEHHKDRQPQQEKPRPPTYTPREGPSNQRKRTFGTQKQGKTYPPKQKRTPQQARQHIRAIIGESFDEGSQEYRDFVKEIEEKGF